MAQFIIFLQDDLSHLVFLESVFNFWLKLERYYFYLRPPPPLRQRVVVFQEKQMFASTYELTESGVTRLITLETVERTVVWKCDIIQ